MGVEFYKPIIVMIGCQFMYAGTSLFVRAALLEDMSSTVFVVYRQFIGFLLMAPFAYFSSRKLGTNGPSYLNWKSFCFIFLLSLGITANQITFYMGLSLITSSVASAMYNLAPAITFIIAYTMGLEKVNVRRWGSIAKIIGTIVCVSSAAAMALLEGPKLLNMELGGVDNHNDNQIHIIGCSLIFASSCFWSLALILQTRVNECYPDLVSMTTWICLMVSLQSGIFTLLVEPNRVDAWKLTSPIQIFSCLFAGITTAVTFFAQAWCIHRRGPLFSALFQPLCTLIVALLGSIVLHEELYLGSLIGGLGVIIGLYIVLWGKAEDNHKEVKEEIKTLDSQVNESCTINLEEPLLPEN